MYARQLLTESGEIAAYNCGKCSKPYNSKYWANHCCRYCKCGSEVYCNGPKCENCQNQDRLIKEKQQAIKAEKLSVPTTEYVYREFFINNGFIRFEDINEDCNEEGGELPPFVYDCKIEVWGGLDADTTIKKALEDHWFNSANEQIQVKAGLEEFLASWNKKQTLSRLWPNQDKIIILDEKRFNSWLEGK